MTILITGGAGFIGSHLARKYLEKKYQVIVIDNFSTGNRKNIEDLITDSNFTLIEGSIFDYNLTLDLVSKADVIFHLAAAVGVKLIVSEPSQTIKNNLIGAQNIFKASKKFNKRIIFASTSEVYGKSKNFPFNESSDLIIGASNLSRWSYACAKLMDEFLAYAYFQESNLPVTIVRLFNTVGPCQTGQYGMVIPTFVEQALSNLDITVFGDGNQSRCFCSVHDVISALTKIESSDNTFGEIINIGTNEEISINELSELVIKLANSNSKIKKIPYDIAYKPGFEDMERRIPDISKAKRLLNWIPSQNLESILNSVIHFYKDK